MTFLFGKTKELIVEIDNFIDLTAKTVFHFKNGIKLYLEDRMDEFDKKLSVIREAEKEADNIRTDVESRLYRQTLIPESRGDVLGVLESMDIIINLSKSNIIEFSIERPVIPKGLKKFFLELADPVSSSVESLTSAVRAYFYNINAVKDHLYKVKFFEKEADILAEKIKRKIFGMKLQLCNKMQLNTFVHKIDMLADQAEEVSERIAIATIKRVI